MEYWRSLDLTRATPARQRWILALFALAAMLLILWFFSPRYVMWPTIKIPEFNSIPDTHRAYFTLLQLKDPFLDIDHFSNKVIEWRLLFPLVFHYLHLPAWLFLALPWIGCLLVLWYAGTLVWQRTRDQVLTAASLVTLGSLSWFFTSTGWLAYFDSWYVLGGLILAFSMSPWLVLAAAALTPWVDERIVFMLPVCLAARAVIYWHDTGQLRPDARQLRLAIAAAVPIFAYALVRLAATIWFDQGSRSYVAFFGERSWPLGGMAKGAWMGLRMAWVPIVLLPLLIARRSRPVGIATGVVIAISAIVAVVIAGDISRSMSMLVPVAVASLMLLPRMHARARAIVVAVAAGNLLLPAAHVIGEYTVPIFDARLELDHFKYPPRHLDARFHLSEAMRQYRAGEVDGVMRSLGYARQVARLPDDLALAIVQFGELEEKQGRFDTAAAFYAQALDTGTRRWTERPAVEERLLRVRASRKAAN